MRHCLVMGHKILQDKKAFFTQLNQEVKVWLLQHQQLQSTNQLSEADVEAIVYRVVNKELATLREEITLAAVASDKKQVFPLFNSLPNDKF